MEFDAAIQLIAVLIAVWTLYVTRHASPPLSSLKKSFEASIACVLRLLQKKSAVLSMLNIVSQKKSRRATGSSTSQKKARDVHVLFTEKNGRDDTQRIAHSKKALPVNKCGPKNILNIGTPIKNAPVSDTPQKKARKDPFMGRKEAFRVPYSVGAWASKKAFA